MAVNPTPDEYRGVTPYLIVDDGNAALDFYQRAFGAEVTMRIGAPGGKVGHAEFKVGGGMVMMADECPDMEFQSPRAHGGTPVSLLLYVDDADAVVARAVEAGAELTQPVENKFYGDRMGSLKDPFGHIWHISTHVEDVPPDEMQRRAAAMSEQG